MFIDQAEDPRDPLLGFLRRYREAVALNRSVPAAGAPPRSVGRAEVPLLGLAPAGLFAAAEGWPAGCAAPKGICRKTGGAGSCRRRMRADNVQEYRYVWFYPSKTTVKSSRSGKATGSSANFCGG